MSFMGDLLSSVFERRYRPWAKPDKEDQRSMETLADELVHCSAEQSILSLSTQILDRFDTLEDDAKRAFFEHVAVQMDIDADAVDSALSEYRASPSESTYRAFATSAEPARQELIRRLNQVAGATGKLVAMRRDLLRLKGSSNRLAALDLDFRHLFASWFNRGFLVLRPISWESPAHILEKIIAYEAVHAIDSWDDLRLRLEPRDRRCFAFFHLSMPDEPLIFVEVALTDGIPGSIQSVLSPDREQLHPDDTNTAVFYSISNCQKGLASISFGNSLIKQVVADLAAEHDKLTTFVTLSPVPGLVSWWQQQSELAQANEPDMRALAAYYLLTAKDDNNKPLDPVARFHLGNGARLEAVHGDADLSDNGQRQSAGVMVNYLYEPDSVLHNHEQFAEQGTIVCSTQVQALSATIKESPVRLGRVND